MTQTPSREKWIQVVSDRLDELTGEIDLVNLQIYITEDAIAYLEQRIEVRDTEFHVNDGPDDSELESVLARQKAKLEALQRLQRAIGSDMTLVGIHLKALKESWPEMDEEVLKVLKHLFNVEAIEE